MIVAQRKRQRKGSASSARGAASFIAASLATSRALGTQGRFLVRSDSAYYNQSAVARALKHGADMSVTVQMNPSIKKAIAAIPEEKWETIEYPQAIFDEDSGVWISQAEAAAFSSKKQAERIPGRLIVRRIPKLNQAKIAAGAQEAFKIYRYHGVFSTVDMDKTHRQLAVVEAVNAELKDGPLAHLPSGNLSANAAWLHAGAIAYNLTRAAGAFTRAKLSTLRTRLILVPARVATSARRIKLHLPRNWSWAEPWERLFTTVQAPPQAA